MAHAVPRRRNERALTLQGGSAIEQFDQGRQCTHPACGAHLSRYNPNDTCAAHGGWREAPQARRRRSR